MAYPIENHRPVLEGLEGFDPYRVEITNGASRESQTSRPSNPLNPLTPGAALLEKCRQLGIITFAQSDSLKYDAPRGAMTPDLLAALGRHKAELLALLARDHARPPAPACAREADPPPAPPESTPAPAPWRRPPALGVWPLAWRQEWADRAEQFEDAGLDWREAEREAFEDVAGRFDPAALDDLDAPRPGPREPEPTERPSGAPAWGRDPLDDLAERGRA